MHHQNHVFRVRKRAFEYASFWRLTAQNLAIQKHPSAPKMLQCQCARGFSRPTSEQTIYTWKKRFGSFQPDDVRRLKQLEQENARLKKLVAERDLEIEVMKEITAKKW
jgi:hypothetical protein